MDFQSRSSLVGKEFEDVVYNDLVERGHTNIKQGVTLFGVESDFVSTTPDGKTQYTEAKGGKNNRPGAQRTDNVKKAIASAFIIRTKVPDAQIVTYYSAAPKKGLSSDITINIALESGLINEVVYKDY